MPGQLPVLVIVVPLLAALLVPLIERVRRGSAWFVVTAALVFTVYVALQLLTKMTEGTADTSDMDMLDELSLTIKDASQCGLGKTAPNPILSTMKYFQEEYQAHVKDKKCQAGVCKPLFAYEINAEACKACGKCKPDCPVDAITGEKKVAHAILSEKCTKCGACYDICPFDAVTKV